jgi:hypothetical protein
MGERSVGSCQGAVFHLAGISVHTQFHPSGFAKVHNIRSRSLTIWTSFSGGHGREARLLVPGRSPWPDLPLSAKAVEGYRTPRRKALSGAQWFPPGFGVRQSSLHLTRISVALRLSFRLGPNVPAPRHCRRPVRGALHLLRPAERSDPTPPLYLPRIQGPSLTSRPSTGPRHVTPATLSGTVPAPGHG